MPLSKFKSEKEGYKICSWCEEEKPATLEYFKACKGALYNVASRCKECDKKYRLQNKKHAQEYSKAYYLENRDRIIGTSQHYRALKNNVSSELTTDEWNQCLDHFNHSCAYCGKQTKDLAQEHFIPISNGGDYNKINIVPACKDCNSSKQARDIMEWYPKQECYDKYKLFKIIEYLFG